MESSFSLLTALEFESLDEILRRRSGALLKRIRRTSLVTHSDADDIVAILGEELADNLDDDLEPTDYGRQISALVARFSMSQVSEWPRRASL